MVPCLKSTFPQAKRRRLRLPLALNTLPMLAPWRWFLAIVIVWNTFWHIPISGRLLCEGEDGDSEDSSADTGGLQTQVRPRQQIKSISNQLPFSGVERSQRPSGRRSSRRSGQQPSCRNRWLRIDLDGQIFHLHNHQHFHICDNLS